MDDSNIHEVIVKFANNDNEVILTSFNLTLRDTITSDDFEFDYNEVINLYSDDYVISFIKFPVSGNVVVYVDGNLENNMSADSDYALSIYLGDLNIYD